MKVSSPSLTTVVTRLERTGTELSLESKFAFVQLNANPSSGDSDAPVSILPPALLSRSSRILHSSAMYVPEIYWSNPIVTVKDPSSSISPSLI